MALATMAHAEGDPSDGKAVFDRTCRQCHALSAGVTKLGPSFHGLIGRRAGAVEGFRYSPAMKKAGENGLVWTAETLSRYIENPRAFVHGNRMPFPGLKKVEDRENVIAYIETETE